MTSSPTTRLFVGRSTPRSTKVIDSGAFAGGPFVAEFEEDFAAYCSCDHAIGVGNGTDALWLALLASGVGPGDEVITVPEHIHGNRRGD